MRQGIVVAALGSAQTVAWASSYYLPAIVAGPAAADLGLRPAWIFGGFSLALVVSALVGPAAGRRIDRLGGRGVLVASNLVLAAGLAGFAASDGPLGLLAAWAVMGLGMGLGLYDTAFATLARLYGPDARRAITGITLIAGFASTVGWPLSGVMVAEVGWRGACLGWVALHLLVALPLNLALPRAAAAQPPDPSAPEAAAPARPAGPAFWLLSALFSIVAFTSTAMAAHLPRLFEATGASTATAIAAGALIGPAQVLGRVVEFALLRGVHPLWSARLAAAAHPLAALGLVLFGAPLAFAFAVLHGLGNGVLTISRGTLPLALFGARGYGLRQGLLVAPARVAQAAAPLAFGLALGQVGAQALWIGIALGALGMLALALIRRPA